MFRKNTSTLLTHSLFYESVQIIHKRTKKTHWVSIFTTKVLIMKTNQLPILL